MRFILSFCAAILLFANAANAASKQMQFQVGPRAGVTVVQLSQAEINSLAQYLVQAYQIEIDVADREYQRAVDALYLDPAIDESGEILNQEMVRIDAAREAGYAEAAVSAVRQTLRACRGLCYVVANGQRFE